MRTDRLPPLGGKITCLGLNRSRDARAIIPQARACEPYTEPGEENRRQPWRLRRRRVILPQTSRSPRRRADALIAAGPRPKWFCLFWLGPQRKIHVGAAARLRVWQSQHRTHGEAKKFPRCGTVVRCGLKTGREQELGGERCANFAPSIWDGRLCPPAGHLARRAIARRDFVARDRQWMTFQP